MEPAAADPARLPPAAPRDHEVWTGELLATQLSHGVTASEPALAVAQARPPSRAPTPKAAPAARGRGGASRPSATDRPRRAGLSAAELAAASAAYDAMYIVRGGDTLAMIALRTGVDPARLMVINGLSDGEHIYEGQRLELEGGPHALGADALLAAQAVAEDRQDQARQVAAARSQPAVSAAQAQAQGPALLADAVPAPSADPIDYGVDSADRVVVVAAETIGHYADWLDVPVANLRALNHLRARSAVLIGSHFKLSFAKVSRPSSNSGGATTTSSSRRNISPRTALPGATTTWRGAAIRCGA